MQPIWSISLHAMQNDGNQVDRIASNMANATTPGYRREIAVQRPFAEVTNQMLTATQLVAARDLPPAADTMNLGRDQRPGTLRSTGRPMDVALTGPGYFEILTPDGPAFSRQGQFAVDERGRLVTETGLHPVSGMDGEIQLSPGSVVIDANGRLLQDGRTVGQLKVIAADAGVAAQSIGQGLYLLDAPARPLSPDQIQLKQGFVENSNVDTAHEMVQLMKHMRHFESMYRMAQAYDDMLGTAVRKLGDL